MRISDLLQAETPPRHTPSPPLSSSPAPLATGREDNDDHDDILPAAIAPTSGRKRPGEDLSQYAEQMARNVRLKPADATELKSFTMLTSPEQRTWIAAHLQKMKEILEKVDVPEPVYIIPPALNARIERYSLDLLLSPTLTAYVKDEAPIKMIIAHLEKHPSWGLTSAVKADTIKYQTIVGRVRIRVTQRRSQIKSELGKSLGKLDDDGSVVGAKDIVELCETLVGLGTRSLELGSSISIPMAARIAFLRCLYSEIAETDPTVKDFWKLVDNKLAEVRRTKKTKERISNFFTTLLNDDRDTYGKPPMNNLLLATADALDEEQE